MIAAFPFTTAWVFFSGEKFFTPEIDWAVIACMVILGSFGYLLLIKALRIGELSAIMPFRYSRIIFLLILGVLVFGERPTFSMLAGSTLILISGLYIMWRERVVTQSLVQD
jgi:drug/metabolite transporter (DMT)-like permease